jgi:hypothetical protein
MVHFHSFPIVNISALTGANASNIFGPTSFGTASLFANDELNTRTTFSGNSDEEAEDGVALPL